MTEMSEQIDLLWDPKNLDIKLDDFDLEPQVIEGINTYKQSIGISIRASVHTQSLIGCEQSEVKKHIINLGDELEELHPEIVLSTLELGYNFQTKTLITECDILMPDEKTLPVFMKSQLSKYGNTI